MEKIENGKWGYCQETEEIIDFANLVFSIKYGGTDFAALLPKAYSKSRCTIPTHHIVKQDNKIRALIDSYPVTLSLHGDKDRKLNAVYVGTVSVHPNTRGKGYMTELMKQVEQKAVELGCALMILDGNRHRYQHYGFERAGGEYRFQVAISNIKHCCAQIYDKAYMELPEYSFKELDEQSPYMDYLYKLYQCRIVTARSYEDFLVCLQSYGAAVYVVLKGDKPVGYVNLSGESESISEVALDDIQKLPKVVYDLMREFDMEQFSINVGVDELDKIEQLEKMCDHCNLSMSHMIKILDYEAVFAFMLSWKQKYSPLVNGDYVIGVRKDETKDVENYLLSVLEGHVKVSRTEKTADTVLEPLELVRILTTNLCFVEQHKGERSKIKNAPAGWFPLPFYLPEADTF